MRSGCEDCIDLRQRVESVREALLEAEAHDDGHDGTTATHYYAFGLRTAAGLLGLPEGTASAARRRDL